MKQLPTFDIIPVGHSEEEKLDSLILAEFLLVMIGYDKPDEEWNNEMVLEDDCGEEKLAVFSDGQLLYSFNPTKMNPAPADLLEIERYVESKILADF